MLEKEKRGKKESGEFLQERKKNKSKNKSEIQIKKVYKKFKWL